MCLEILHGEVFIIRADFVFADFEATYLVPCWLDFEQAVS